MRDASDRWPGLRRAFRLPRSRRRLAEAVDEELRFHLEERADELVARGMARAQAEREARARFGDVDGYRAQTRAIDERILLEDRRLERLDALGRELRQAARTLARSRGFAALAVLTLALGVGATTAIYTVLDAVVLRPLPYAASERLVSLSSPVPGVKPDAVWGISQAGYFDFRERSRTLEAIAAYSRARLAMEGDGQAELVQSAAVTASLFDVLRLRPVHGRLFTAAEDRPRAAPVGVLGHEFWTQRFGADPAVLGRTVRIDPYGAVQIVGVMERGANLPDQPVDLWLPLQLDPSAPPQNSHMVFHGVVARLRPGTTLAAAQGELTRLTRDFPRRFPTAYSETFFRETGFDTRVVSLRDDVVGSTAQVLWILLAAVGLVLAIACANVGNLFLVRAETRRREVAVRAALGAGRAHLALHFLAESLLIATAAALLAVGLAAAGLRVLVAMAPASLPRLAEVQLGWRGGALAVTSAVLAALLFGLVPLARAARAADVKTLREGGRGMSASRGQRAARGAFVVAQVALALVLLAAAGLMAESYRRLRAVRPGFDAAGVLAVSLSLPRARYDSYDKVAAFHRDLATRLRALPNVREVGAGNVVPLAGYDGCSNVFLEGRPVPPGAEPPCIGTHFVAPGYFAALGMRVRGAAPEWVETQGAAAGVVVTRALARRLWPGEDAIGRGIKCCQPGPPYYRVVGVADDVRGGGLDQPPTEAVFFPVVPLKGTVLWSPQRSMSVLVRTSLDDPVAITPAVRRVLAQLDPSVPLGSAEPMSRIVAKSLARTSFTLLLLGVAAAMALALSAVGIYGVISYVVGQRRGEIGIRMALGAPVAQVKRLVVLQSVRLAALGVGLGLVAAVASTRVLASLLFEVSPTDPRVLALVAVALVGLAAAASYVPARRASRVDPAEALRAE